MHSPHCWARACSKAQHHMAQMGALHHLLDAGARGEQASYSSRGIAAAVGRCGRAGGAGRSLVLFKSPHPGKSSLSTGMRWGHRDLRL